MCTLKAFLPYVSESEPASDTGEFEEESRHVKTKNVNVVQIQQEMLALPVR